MKVSIDKKQLVDALTKASVIVPTKSGDYLKSVWIDIEQDNMTINTSDSSIYFSSTIECEAECVSDSGNSFGVGIKSFLDLVKRLKTGTVEIEAIEGEANIVVRQGGGEYTLPTANSDWRDVGRVMNMSNGVLWSSEGFLDVINRLEHCLSEDDTIEGISCMYLKGECSVVKCTALNGHQLANYSFENEALSELLQSMERDVLIPRQYVSFLKRLLFSGDITIHLSDGRCAIESGNMSINFPLSNKTYPDCEHFLSKLESAEAYLRLDREVAVDTLERVSVFNTDMNRSVLLELGEDLTFKVKGKGYATESMSCEFEGDIERIAFPTKNLSGMLKKFDSVRVNLALCGDGSPCGITGADGDTGYTVIIMPMNMEKVEWS